MPKLTAKQSVFVQEYLIDLNATQAAIRAGYSENSAMEQGYQLLQKTSVVDAIRLAQDERSARLEIEADWVLGKIKSDVVRNSDDETYNSPNLLKGCELLGKHLKLFTDKSEVSGPGGGPIEHKWEVEVIDATPSNT